MKINEIHQSRREFKRLLQRLSQNPTTELDALGHGADHVTIRVAHEDQKANEPSSSLHIVVDPAVYNELSNLPRADYLRNALVTEDKVVGVLSVSHAAHHAKKLSMLSQFRRSKVIENLATMVEVINMQLGRWQQEGSVSPFAAAQTIAVRYFSRFAFGVDPPEQEIIAIAKSSSISSELKLRTATDHQKMAERSLPDNNCPRESIF